MAEGTSTVKRVVPKLRSAKRALAPSGNHNTSLSRSMTFEWGTHRVVREQAPANPAKIS